MKIISYSLFGYNKERYPGCDNFNSYLRGFMINLRLARLLFPSWKIRVHIDRNTYAGLQRFWELLKPHHSNALELIICDDALLTKAMLWRMLPAFDTNVKMFICRDTDAPLTYRDAQAVKQWEDSSKQAHTITDSVSHTIPMMGGMIGFKNEYFKDYTGFTDWSSMVGLMSGYDRKGADQDFLCQYVHPKFASNGNSSIMEHYFLGYMPRNVTDGYKTCSCVSVKGHTEGCHLDYKLDIPSEYKETNLICGHIGAAGNYEVPTYSFLGRYFDKFKDIQLAEALHTPYIFNWKI